LLWQAPTAALAYLFLSPSAAAAILAPSSSTSSPRTRYVSIKNSPPQPRSSTASSRSVFSVMPLRSGSSHFVSTDARLRLTPGPSNLKKVRSSKQAAPLHQVMVRRPRSPLDPDRELHLQSPATTFNRFFGRLVCASNTPSIRLQPMLSTVSHLVVRTPGASSSVRRRAPRPPLMCSCCCVYPIKGLFCNYVFFGGPICKTGRLI
jgi:hypothetical protein